jgi:hypothetical protein
MVNSFPFAAAVGTDSTASIEWMGIEAFKPIAMGPQAAETERLKMRSTQKQVVDSDRTKYRYVGPKKKEKELDKIHKSG